MNNSDIMPQLSKESISSITSPAAVGDIAEFWTDSTIESSNKKRAVIKALLSKQTEDSDLIYWLKQLKDNVSHLDKEYERLISALLCVDWPCRSEEVIVVYKELILNLVSVNSIYLIPVLNMIIKLFYSALNENNVISKEENECYQKAHNLLQEILLLIPIAGNVMCSLLAENFPYLKRPSHIILRYVVNILNITTYFPSCRLIILGCLMEKVLEIDVHCPRDIIEASEIENEEQKEIFTSLDGLQDSGMAHPLANTLDLLLEKYFSYLDCTCFNSDKKELQWDTAKKVFQEMLTVFDQYILPTHRCSHIQFLLFYVCSWKPLLCEAFLDYLWKKVKNPNTSPILRQVATFYIGSLLARASYVNMSTVTAMFDMLSEWIHIYINNYDSQKCTEVTIHGTFHCVCQVLFYVFAFRHKEFINMDNGIKYLRKLNFERIISCRLNPLKFCQPIIVQNFASITRNYQIVYCYPVIERNNRSLASGIIHAEESEGMKWFFPYDPYLLKHSKKWIEPIYRLYDNDEITDIKEIDDIGEELNRQSVNTSLFSYGSSPGFKTSNSVSPDFEMR